MINETLKNKVINKTIYVIIFLVPLLMLPSQLDSVPSNILKYITLLICGSILLVMLFLKRRELKFDLIDKTLMAFYILMVISTIFSMDIMKSIFGERNRYEGLLTFTVYFLTYYCGKYYFYYNKKLKTFSIITICITCIIGILQYYNIFPLYYIYDIFGIPYRPGFASSTFGNTNFFGSFLAMIVTCFMALYIVKKKKSYLVISYLSFYMLILSMTRSAWVGFALASIFGIIYIIINRTKEVIKRAIHILIGFVVIFVWLLFTPSIITDALPYYSQTMSLQNRLGLMSNELQMAIEDGELDNEFGSHRIRIWRMTLKAIAVHPLLGSGPDTLAYSLLYNATEDAIEFIEVTNTYADKAHNEYLQIAATMGIPALIVYMAFVTQILAKNKNMFKDNSTFILMIPIIAYLVQAFFNISTIGVAPIFWLLLGLIQNREFKESLSA